MADLHVICDTNAADIPAMLRQRADAIEAGETTKTAILVAVDEAGEVETFGWGETDAMDTLATLQIASFKLCRIMVDG